MKNASFRITAILLCFMVTLSVFAGAISVSAETKVSNFVGIPYSYVDAKGNMHSNLKAPTYDEVMPYGIIPEKYDSRDYGLVSPVKDQGATGTCWAFSALAACESSLMARGQTDTFEDFSELHLAYTTYHDQYDALGCFDSTFDPNFLDDNLYAKDWLNVGGFYNTALYALASWQGIVSEDVNHGQYSAKKMETVYASLFEIFDTEEYYSLDSLHVQNAINVYVTNPAAVKSLIMEYGAGTVHINSDSLNSETNTFYSPYDVGVNHVVTLVGWDDNYPRENCEVYGEIPLNDGAWLIKNSWGTYLGDEGYYWVSYESKELASGPVQFIDLEPSDNYDNNYQYDDVFDSDNILCNGNPDDLMNEDGYYDNSRLGIVGGGIMANRYTAQKDDEVLKAVGFYTFNENLSYEIIIYKFDGADFFAVSSQQGEQGYMGYHTVELDTPVELTKGEDFMVGIELTDKENPDTPIRFVYDQPNSGIAGFEKHCDFGESYIYTDAEGWVDVKEFADGNLRIKAFTDSREETKSVDDYYESYNGKTRNELMEELSLLVNSTYAEVVYDTLHYSKNSLDDFSEYYHYAYSLIVDDEWPMSYPELYTAREFDGIIEELNRRYDALLPFDIYECVELYYVDSEIVPGIEAVEGYEQYVENYNEIANMADVDEMTWELLYDEIIPFASSNYQNIMIEVIKTGYGGSRIQLYGDVDNSGVVNVKDATKIQKILAMTEEYDIYSENRADVNHQFGINVKDATEVQKLSANVIEYLGIYDMQFGVADESEMFDFVKVSRETAINNLEAAVKAVNDNYYIDYLLEGNFAELTLGVAVLDAEEVLNNPDGVHAQIIDFKARNIMWIMSNMGAAG